MGGGSVRHACFQNDDRGWCAEVVVFSLVGGEKIFSNGDRGGSAASFFRLVGGRRDTERERGRKKHASKKKIRTWREDEGGGGGGGGGGVFCVVLSCWSVIRLI